MAKKSIPDPKRAVNDDQKFEQVNPYLRTEKAHQDWYEPHHLGKQRSKPRIAPIERKKAPKGWRKT